METTKLWFLAIPQTVATALMLVATAELKGVVWQVLRLGETRAALQLPFAGLVFLAGASLIPAAVATVRRVTLDRLGVWFAVLFLVSVAASSAQALGAWRMWLDNTSPIPIRSAPHRP